MKDGTEREAVIGANRIYLDEDDIMNFICAGDIDERIALEFKEAIYTLCKLSGKKGLDTCVDINKTGKVSSKARKVFKDLTADREFNGGRCAFVGMHPVARVIASFFIAFQENKDLMRFFNSREDALSWLRNDADRSSEERK